MGQQQTYEIKAIDLGANLFTIEANRIRPKEAFRRFYTGKIGVDPNMYEGVSLEQMIDKMDRAAIEITLLIATKAPPFA